MRRSFRYSSLSFPMRLSTGILLACILFAAVAAAAVRAAPAPAGQAGVVQSFGLFGLSSQEVEEFEFSRRYVGSTMRWRLEHTDRDLLKLLRQRAKFVLQNNPDALSKVNADLVVLITDRLGVGDVPPPTPPGPNPPGPQPPQPPPGPTPPPPIGSPVVYPGQPDRSSLVRQVEGSALPGMPYNRPLPHATRRLFRDWVAGGATEAAYRAKLAPVVTANCVFCHNRQTAAGRLSLESWDDLKARIAARLASR